MVAFPSIQPYLHIFHACMRTLYVTLISSVNEFLVSKIQVQTLHFISETAICSQKHLLLDTTATTFFVVFFYSVQNNRLIPAFLIFIHFIFSK